MRERRPPDWDHPNRRRIHREMYKEAIPSKGLAVTQRWLIFLDNSPGEYFIVRHRGVQHEGILGISVNPDIKSEGSQRARLANLVRPWLKAGIEPPRRAAVNIKDFDPRDFGWDGIDGAHLDFKSTVVRARKELEPFLKKLPFRANGNLFVTVTYGHPHSLKNCPAEPPCEAHYTNEKGLADISEGLTWHVLLRTVHRYYPKVGIIPGDGQAERFHYKDRSGKPLGQAGGGSVPTMTLWFRLNN